ncbi:leucine/isoleucine/valine transporter permease subunit [Candidatus Magnetomorum sp. HK-1]|nr:leucine/isoleucine/valine transporter permease subunit [Candidatus Magnetomorum sp. HK-1]
MQRIIEQVRSSFWIALWFILLTFPIMVIKVNTIDHVIEWRFKNMLWVGLFVFLLSFVWRKFMQDKGIKSKKESFFNNISLKIHIQQKYYLPLLIFFVLTTLVFPHLVSAYQVNIMTTAMIYVVLGLGLNIVVGLAGLLDLGYVAFYAVGAYAYALLNYHFQINFWAALPLCALLSASFGVLLGFPVLRLRGDYLAIVTLGFGEIIRLILENWNEFSFGPSGIANIPRPPFVGLENNIQTAAIFMYYLMLLMVLFTIFMVNRLQNSRIGRAWIALREDEIACQAMGIDKTRTKLLAFALGATWAGLMGAFFAAKTTFINPACFTFLESAIILSIVVLGGMGSILGVIIAAFILILLPEYLRAFSEYRMLIFGASMVLMMVFRPQGLVSKVKRTYGEVDNETRKIC